MSFGPYHWALEDFSVIQGNSQLFCDGVSVAPVEHLTTFYEVSMVWRKCEFFFIESFIVIIIYTLLVCSSHILKLLLEQVIKFHVKFYQDSIFVIAKVSVIHPD